MGRKRKARERVARRAAELTGQDAATAAVTEALASVAEGIRRQDKALKVQAGTLAKIAKQGCAACANSRNWCVVAGRIAA
jgi:hypothetical protein